MLRAPHSWQNTNVIFIVTRNRFFPVIDNYVFTKLVITLILGRAIYIITVVGEGSRILINCRLEIYMIAVRKRFSSKMSVASLDHFSEITHHNINTFQCLL